MKMYVVMAREWSQSGYIPIEVTLDEHYAREVQLDTIDAGEDGEGKVYADVWIETRDFPLQGGNRLTEYDLV